MRFQQALALAAIAGFAATACKKDPANERPRISILQPADGASLTVPDTLLVKVEAHDDIGLERVYATLLDANGIPAVGGVSAAASGTSAVITLALPVVSQQLPGGLYTLRVTASDGSLTGWDTRSLHITAVPLRLRAVFSVVQPSAGAVALYRTDSTGQTSLAATWDMDLGGAAISSAAQRLFIAGAATGPLLALDPDGLLPAWQVPNQSSAGLPWFTGMDLCADGRLYACMADGTVHGYTAATGTGGTVAALQEQFRAERCITNGDQLICTSRHFLTGERRLYIFHRTTGAQLAVQALSIDPAGLFTRDGGHVLLFGNSNGQGRVLDRTLEGGGDWETFTWGAAITAVVRVAPNAWLVALANGALQRYSYGGGALPLASTPVLHTLAYDEVDGRAYGGADGQVIALDPATGATTGTAAVNGTTVRILPLYNR